MKASVYRKLAPASPRIVVIAVAALTACGAASRHPLHRLATASKRSTIPPTSPSPLPRGGRYNVADLMGVAGDGDTIHGSYGSGSRRSRHRMRAHVAQQDVHLCNTIFPGLVPPFNATQTQMTAVNGNGTTFARYTFQTTRGAHRTPVRLVRAGRRLHNHQQPKTPDCSPKPAAATSA